MLYILYHKIYNYYKDFNEQQPYVFYNNLTQMNMQFLLILSACELNDQYEDKYENRNVWTGYLITLIAMFVLVYFLVRDEIAI